MAKRATNKAFEKFSAEDILTAWLKALREGAGDSVTFSSEITSRKGEVAEGLRSSINEQLKVRAFDALAFRASTRVAKDTGKICAMMVATAKSKRVGLDLFQQVRELTRSHPSCPEPAPGGGSGPFCD